MQKRVLSSAIALALTALASGTALAQSSVTIYGNIDVSFDHIKKDAGAANYTALVGATGNAAINGKQSINRVGPDMSSQSSLGFKGVEDLGGGLKAKFQLEAAVAADTGASASGRFFDRAAWVGLASAEAGELRIGRQDSLIGAQIAEVIGAQEYDASVVAVTLGGKT